MDRKVVTSEVIMFMFPFSAVFAEMFFAFISGLLKIFGAALSHTSVFIIISGIFRNFGVMLGVEMSETLEIIEILSLLSVVDPSDELAIDGVGGVEHGWGFSFLVLG